MFGGVLEIWQILTFTSEQKLSQDQLLVLEQQVGQAENLAVVLYQLHRYEEARKILADLIDISRFESEFYKSLHYNLGNALYRLSEQEKDPFRAMKMLHQSLKNYRTTIELEIQKPNFSSTPIDRDDDTQINYILV